MAIRLGLQSFPTFENFDDSRVLNATRFYLFQEE
jgi:hypothetical protein